MDLGDFFGPIDLAAENRWEAIEEMVNHLVTVHQIKLEDKEAVLAGVKKRETAMSTGIGFGIAIPHAATDLVEEVTTVVGRSRKGVAFDAVDGKPAHLVILFLVPHGQFQKHLHTLANIAKLAHSKDFRDGLWGRFE